MARISVFHTEDRISTIRGGTYRKEIMSAGIYAFFDKDGDCLYVGQSSDIESRRASHIKCLRGGYHKRKEFVEWYRENENSLEFKVLEECDDNPEIKNALEVLYFNELRPRFYGQVPSLLDKFRHSDETKAKIAKTVRRNLEDAGVYKDIVCPCGLTFSTWSSRPASYCSLACSRSLSSLKDWDRDSVIPLYNSGMTLHQIGESLGVSYRTVHKYMVKNNIPRRRPGNI